MSVLDETKKSLEELAKGKEVPMQGAFYGGCGKELKEWNYFVFRRKTTEKASNKMDRQTKYIVTIVHEDFIPEGYVDEVIAKLESQCAGAKLKQTADPIDYIYTFKGKTDVVVELASITFVHPEKRC